MSRPQVASMILATFLLAACARSHVRPGAGDGGASFEDGGADGIGSPSDGVPCGPNRCYDGEICCRASCGLCTDADACLPSLPCRRSEVVCGGVVCSASTSFCCSSCEGEVCAGPGLVSRAECPSVSCE